MPQLGETVTEGTITKWLKAVGDAIARDEPLFEVSTDKVDSEVPSPADGVLTGDPGRGGGHRRRRAWRWPSIGGAAANGAARRTETRPLGCTNWPRPAPAPEAADAPPPAPAPACPCRTGPWPPAPATARRPPCRSLPCPDEPVPSPAAADPTGARPFPSVPSGADQARVLSPVVRKLLAEHAIDPATIRGTGSRGTTTRSDVEALHRTRGPLRPSSRASASARRPRLPAAAPPAPPRAPPRRLRPARLAPTGAPRPRRRFRSGPSARDEVVPFTSIRRVTAEHMVRSKATSAHTLMVKEIDYERVEQVRRAYGERFRDEEGFSLTYLPFVARATVEALAEYPDLNASVGEDALIVHHDVNLGVAVDLDNEGLIVPVVHHAEELTLRGMARRIRDLADRARTKRLSLDDISAGTFSITNAGPFGTLITGAIINQPQVAILSTDGVSRRPVVIESPDGTESVGIHSMGLVAMNFDHRAVDGAYVARFLARLASILDDRDWVGEL